jgi:hypothetical protein
MSKTLLMVLLFGFATAASATTEPAVSVTEGSFAAQARAIEKTLSDGKTYAEMSRAERDEVRSILGRMANRLEGVQTVEELSENDRLELFNDQERVNAMLVKGYADSRLVCDKQGRTGTHFRETRCQTVAERRRRSEIDQNNMRAVQRSPVPLSN